MDDDESVTSDRAHSEEVPNASIRTRDVEIPSYFPALDGLRFFCCTAVVIAHSFHEASIIADESHPLHALVGQLGWAGVDLFFSLSGFLITHLLLREKSRHGKINLTKFYIRRTLRIWPVYYAALAAGFGGLALIGEPFARPLAADTGPNVFSVGLPYYLMFLGNWEHTATVPTSIGILWSVCVEEQFYVLFPLTFARSSRSYAVFRVVAVGLAISIATRTWQVLHGTPAGEIYRNTFGHSDNLLLGALLAQAAHRWPQHVTGLFRRLGTRGEGLVCTAYLVFVGIDTSRFETVSYYFFSALFCTVVIGTFAFGGGAVVGATQHPTLRWLGGLTYAGYAYHMYGIVLAWFIIGHLTTDAWAGALLRSMLAIPFTFALAYGSRLAIENHFMRLKKRYEADVA